MRFVGICPESMMDAANQFSAVIGMSMDDARTYRSALWTDGKTKFSIATHDADIDLNQVLSFPLVRPDWDVDEIINMTDAGTIASSCVISMGEISGQKMNFLIGEHSVSNLLELGLSQIQIDEI